MLHRQVSSSASTSLAVFVVLAFSGSIISTVRIQSAALEPLHFLSERRIQLSADQWAPVAEPVRQADAATVRAVATA
jgi:hypothetical protein